MQGMHEQAFNSVRMFMQVFQEAVRSELLQLHGVGKTLDDPKVRETFYRNLFRNQVVKAVKMLYHTVAAAGEGDDFGTGAYSLKPMVSGFEGLRWFKETPKKPGLYLWRAGTDPNYFSDDDGDPVYLEMELAFENELTKKLRCKATHRSDWGEVPGVGFWLGPIPAAWPPQSKKSAKVVYSEEASKHDGDLMTVSEFKGAVYDGMFNDDDGHGRPMRDGKISYGMQVYPSRLWEIPEDATHVMWFNK